jgi:hypothetical protein
MKIQDAVEAIASKFPGCPEPELISAYRYALIDFCTRSRCMTAWVTTTTADMAVATLAADQQVVDIIDALLDDEEIDIVGINDRAVTRATNECPVLTWQNPTLPIVIPEPPTSLDIQMLMVFAPGPAAEDIEDAVWIRHSEDINHGAMARLFAEANQPYTNLNLATYHEGLFERAIAKIAAKLGATRKTKANRLRTKPAGL